MIYKFKSKAAGDVIMVGDTGDRLLQETARRIQQADFVHVASVALARQAVGELVQQGADVFKGGQNSDQGGGGSN